MSENEEGRGPGEREPGQAAGPPDGKGEEARGWGDEEAWEPGPRSKETEDERFLQGARPEVEEPPVPLPIAKDAWRVFRIMGEFVEGFDELVRVEAAVSIFGSARVGRDDPYYEKCVETARLLGERGFAIITGGGPGIMEAANRGAREAGSTSVGCNIELPFEQALNEFVDLPINFRYFFVRKTMFMKYAEGFVIFPGGFGTMDELFEALTLIQTGKVRDFPVVLFGTEYWSGLVDWIRGRMLAEGKIAKGDLDLFCMTDDPEHAARHVAEHCRRAVYRHEGRHL